MPWEGTDRFCYSNLLTSLRDSQIHRNNVFSFSRFLLHERISKLEVANDISVVSPHMDCATCLDIDSFDNRFLLSGGKQGTIALHDLETSEATLASNLTDSKTVLLIQSTRLHPSDYHSISALNWYPIDSGLFLTASFGGRMSLFDSKVFQPVLSYEFARRKVLAAKFHRTGSIHGCIAVGLDNGLTVLCDPRVGDQPISRFQTHSSAVNSVDWSPMVDHQLMTGGDDGGVRIWDIRTSAGTSRIPLLSLDWTNDHTFHVPVHNDKFFQSVNSQHSGVEPMPMPATWVHAGNKDIGSLASRAASVVAHSGPVKQANFTPCGRFILSVGNDAAVRLWESHSGVLQPQRYNVHHGSSPLSLPCVLWRIPAIPCRTPRSSLLHQREDDVFVMPVAEKTGGHRQYRAHSRSSSSFSNSASANACSLAICPLFGASGRPVKYLSNGHVQGPITGLAVRNALGKDTGNASPALVSSSSDGLIVLWKSSNPESVVSDNEEEEDDDENEDTKVKETARTRSSQRRRIQDHVESRYNFERDVLERRFASSESPSTVVPTVSRRSTTATEDDLNPRVNGSSGHSNTGNRLAVPSEERCSRHSDSTNVVSEDTAVSVHELESAPRQYLPPILREYLLQARFVNRNASNNWSRNSKPTKEDAGIRHTMLSQESQQTKTKNNNATARSTDDDDDNNMETVNGFTNNPDDSNHRRKRFSEPQTSINWSEVDAILANDCDDDGDDDFKSPSAVAVLTKPPELSNRLNFSHSHSSSNHNDINNNIHNSSGNKCVPVAVAINEHANKKCAEDEELFGGVSSSDSDCSDNNNNRDHQEHHHHHHNGNDFSSKSLKDNEKVATAATAAAAATAAINTTDPVSKKRKYTVSDRSQRVNPLDVSNNNNTDKNSTSANATAALKRMQKLRGLQRKK